MNKFNIEKLKAICEMKYFQFRRYGKYNKEGDYYFKDNGAKILAVAHLDYIGKPKHFLHVPLSHKELVFSPVLDDRLGAFLILEHLNKMNIKYDVLLTNDEEMGSSTAANFKTTKEYNWIFQFDRAGEDVVMYDYENEEMRKLLTAADFKVGIGSYTDITKLQDLGCKAFNFGTSYNLQHTSDCFANLTALQTTIAKFKKFYDLYKDTKFPHTKVTNAYDDYYGYYDYYWNKRRSSRKWEDDSVFFLCSDCGRYASFKKIEDEYGTMIAETCRDERKCDACI